MIDKLDFLLALAREQHFGHAAEACGVTQQTLSAGVKQLENRFGVQLVLRGSRFQGFTPEGERVLAWARRIVADARAMHEEVTGLRRGLTGHLRIAAIPTALPMVARLTTPYRERHPDVRLTIESATSTDIFSLIENLEADAGLTYLDNEPLGRVVSVPLYQERYRFVTAAGGPYDWRDSVTWAETGQVPLCLLTPNMQNRRIIDQQIRAAGGEPAATLESNSMIVLLTHVRTLRWACASSTSSCARRCSASPAWYCSAVCSDTAAWLARMRSTDRSPGSGSTDSPCRPTSAPMWRPSNDIGTRTHRPSSAVRVACPARTAPSSRRTNAGSRVSSSTTCSPEPSSDPVQARNRGRAPGRCPSETASSVHSASRWAAAARTTSSSRPRGPSTVRTRAREIESMARTARWVRSSERT